MQGLLGVEVAEEAVVVEMVEVVDQHAPYDANLVALVREVRLAPDENVEVYESVPNVARRAGL